MLRNFDAKFTIIFVLVYLQLDLITRENVHDAKQNFIALKQVQKLIVDDDVDSLSSTLDISKSASAAQGSAKSSFKILTSNANNSVPIRFI